MKSEEIWEVLKDYILTSGVLKKIWDEYARYSYNDNVDKYHFDSLDHFLDQARKGLNKHKPWKRLNRVKDGDKIIREFDIYAYGDEGKTSDGRSWTIRNIIPAGVSFLVTEKDGKVIDITTKFNDDWQRSCDIQKEYCPDPNRK